MKLQSKQEKIEVFDHRAIDEVAGIFLNELPEDYCSLMGSRFLRGHFLPNFLDVDPHIGYIAKNRGQVVGFVLGAKAGGYYINFAKHHFVGLAMYSLAACLRDIRRLGYFVDVGRVMFGADAFKPLVHDLELLYICVAKGYQGTGVGVRLVEALLEKGRQLGFDRCVVKTREATESTNRFYRKCGFDPRHHNRGRIWYSNSIASVKEGTAP